MIEQLLQRSRLLWRGDGARMARTVQKTGFSVLDALLPDHGWPNGAVMEVSVSTWGIGELSLWLPAIREHQRQGRYASCLAPPYLPYAPAFHQAGVDLERLHYIAAPIRDRDLFWAAEKLLGCSACGLVLAWPQTLSSLELRRLQLAAQQNEGRICLFRLASWQWEARGASLQLQLASHTGGLTVRVVRARGSCHAGREAFIDDPRIYSGRIQHDG